MSTIHDGLADPGSFVAHFATRAYLRTPPDVEWEDLCQEGWVHLLLAGVSFDPSRGTRFTTWAGERIRTGIANFLRTLGPTQHRGLKGEREANDVGHFDVRGRRRSNVDLIHLRWSRRTRDAAREAVGRLPSIQQEILALLYGWDLTSREAAKELGCTWAYVEAQQRLAIVKLRADLAPLICGSVY